MSRLTRGVRLFAYIICMSSFEYSLSHCR